MPLDQARIDELWRITCEDAGYVPDEPMLVLATKASVDRSERNAYFDPGAEVEARYLPLTDGELARLRQAEGRHRIAVAADANEPQMLGLMRWGLEHARQFDERGSLMDIYGHALNTMSIVYRPLGAGSSLIGNLIPAEEDANAASAALVTTTFGPQFGELAGPWGTLFRPAEQGTMDSLPKRMVAFVSLHPDDFQRYAGDREQRDMLLRAVDRDAPDWWEALMADADHGHFRALIPYFKPTRAEIAAAPAPVEAWRPLAELLRRGQLRGMAVIA